MSDDRNRLIAERVMGWKLSRNTETDVLWVYQGECELLHPVPDYLHDERACHEALEKMRADGWRVNWDADGTEHPAHSGNVITLSIWNSDNHGWDCFIGRSRSFCEAAVDAMIKATEPTDDG